MTGVGATGEDATIKDPAYGYVKRIGRNLFEDDGKIRSNEVQSLEFVPDFFGKSATTGFFRLSHSGATTADIAFGETAANIQKALWAAGATTPLANNVFVRGGPGATGIYFFEFAGTTADTNVANFVVLPPDPAGPNPGLDAGAPNIGERLAGDLFNFGGKPLAPATRP